ncbi:MAG: sugar phosphate isomerase/epimerase [Planctomycetes bacterium]|nr:sugar phosphate isomerase/epimerase [Planctomycetota bacterium]
MRLTRRQVLKSGATAAGLAMTAGLSLGNESLGFVAQAQAVEPEKNESASRWQIGCFNRPWTTGSYDEALAGMQAAGFRLTGLLGDHKGEPFTSPEATPEYLDRLKERMTARGLTPIVGWLRTRHDLALTESLTLAKQQIEHAQRLGVKYMLTVGVDPPAQFGHFYRVMADTAQFASERKIQIVVKPHGGCSLAASEILRCIERVGHDNFRVWFDPGNIIHYSPEDPAVEAARLARYVTGVCAKDCAGRGGNVMLPFGTGKVNFAEVFARLKAAGFSGPVLVECCGGETLEQVTAGARANRTFLEDMFRTL